MFKKLPRKKYEDYSYEESPIQDQTDDQHTSLVTDDVIVEFGNSTLDGCIDPIDSKQSYQTDIKNETLHAIEPIENIKKISFLRAGIDLSRFAIPFTLSRLAVAINVLGNGFVTPKISAEAASAGPLMISTAYATIGPCRSVLMATGILIGKEHGEMLALEKEGDIEGAKKARRNIGRLVRQSIVLGLLMAIPSAALFAGIGPLLNKIGVDAGITHELSRFLNYTSIGLLPIYWSTSDQQFALATGHKNIPMVFGTLFPVLSMLIGYPLAFGAIGLPKLDTAGLGLGMSLAAWASFLSLRAYFFKSDFKQYNLYKMEAGKLFNKFSRLLKLGLPLAFQAFSEWLNLFLVSTFIGLKSKNNLMAANGSFQILTASNLIIAALGQATSISISRLIGEMKIAAKNNSLRNFSVLNTNSKRIGYAGIAVATGVSIGLSSTLIALTRPIQSLFIDSNASNYEEILTMAQAMIIINAIGMIVDTIRNTAASALGGSKDVVFAPVISFITMTLMALTTGALLTDYFDFSSSWLFITRDIGILMAATLIAAKWFFKNHEAVVKQEIVGETQLECTEKPIFKKNSCLDKFRFFSRQEPSQVLERQPLIINDEISSTSSQSKLFN